MPRFVFIAFLFICFAGNAQVLNNNLVIISENGNRFILYINGEKINNEPQANVKAYGISEGWCRLKVEFEKNNISVTDSIHIKPIEKNNNKEITYSIRQNSKNMKFSFVSIGEPSGPKTPRVPEEPADKGPVIDNNTYGNLYKAIANKPFFFHNYNDSLKLCSIELTDKDIEYAKNLITKTNDIQNRYNYSESIMDHNCYTCSQVIQLLNLVEIEMDKLKLIKRNYHHIKDKANATKIEEVFKFRGMKEDFNLFLISVANSERQKQLNCSVAISEENLQEIITAIKKGQYEPDRIEIAKEKVVDNCLNTQQIEKLLSLFKHDREKLELAKSAYAVTVDKENYKILTENFQFTENKKELLNFISK